MNNFFLEACRKGNVYHSANVTVGDVTVLSATCTGLVLENPFTSGKNLVVESMSAVGVSITTVREIGIAVSSSVQSSLSTSTTAAVIHNGRPTGSNRNKGVGLSYSIATLASTPLWFRPLASARVTAADEGVEGAIAEFDGTVIVTPGTYICFSALTTAAASILAITWAEEDE